MKAISIRIDETLGRQFDEVCQKTGYKKNTLLTRLIASFVKHHRKGISDKKKFTKDPFIEVVGLMKSDSLLTSSEAIDKAVYDL